jgi:hypothetical protein
VNDSQLIWEAWGQNPQPTRGWTLDELKVEIQQIEDEEPRAQATYLKGVVEDLLQRKTANVLEIRQTLEAGNIKPEAIKALFDFDGPYMGQGRN